MPNKYNKKDNKRNAQNPGFGLYCENWSLQKMDKQVMCLLVTNLFVTQHFITRFVTTTNGHMTICHNESLLQEISLQINKQLVTMVTRLFLKI